MISLLPEPNAQEASVINLTVELCNRHIKPHALEDEAHDIFRRSIFDHFKQSGLTALLIPPEWGGQGKSASLYYRVLSQIARVSASYSITVGVHQMIQASLLEFGTESQKETFLRALVTGSSLGAFSLSESGSGSDASSLKTTATLTPKGYVLNGTKLWCSNGSDADLFLVMARTGGPGPQGISAFMVSKNTPGLSVGKKERKLGLRASSLTELIFDQCLIPAHHRLGDEGAGFKVALSQLDSGRIGIAATALGLAHEALEKIWTLGHVDKVFLFGDGVKAEWAQHFAHLQAAHTLLLMAAQQKDEKKPIRTLAAQCKLLASELAMQMTSFAVETAEYLGIQPHIGLERLMRDAKALQIVEGTSQIQKLVLSKELDKMVGL